MKETIYDEHNIINEKICTELVIHYNNHYDEIREFLKEWQITVGQYELLGHISMYNGITQKDLSRTLIMVKSNIGQSLFKLKMAKLISYEKKLNKQYIYITLYGKKLLEQLNKKNKIFYSQKYKNLTHNEKKELYRLLQIINYRNESSM